jgi:DNA-binding protein H-NS
MAIAGAPKVGRGVFYSEDPVLADLGALWEAMQVRLGNIDLYSVSIDELWTLHEQVGAVLSEKIVAEKRQLEERLARLNRAIANKGKMAGARSDQRGAVRRKYPPVLPKYQNPNDRSETWAGRGKQPRWLVSQIKAGKKMSDFLISQAERQSASKRRST